MKEEVGHMPELKVIEYDPNGETSTYEFLYPAIYDELFNNPTGIGVILKGEVDPMTMQMLRDQFKNLQELDKVMNFPYPNAWSGKHPFRIEETAEGLAFTRERPLPALPSFNFG